jgi:hypothetical protein
MKLMKLHISLDTVAVVDDSVLINTGGIVTVVPHFACSVLRETIDNIPDEDIEVDVTEIKNKDDLPSGWDINALPFMDKQDRSIKTILKEGLR